MKTGLVSLVLAVAGLPTALAFEPINHARALRGPLQWRRSRRTQPLSLGLQSTVDTALLLADAGSSGGNSLSLIDIAVKNVEALLGPAAFAGLPEAVSAGGALAEVAGSALEVTPAETFGGLADVGLGLEAMTDDELLRLADFSFASGNQPLFGMLVGYCLGYVNKMHERVYPPEQYGRTGVYTREELAESDEGPLWGTEWECTECAGTGESDCFSCNGEGLVTDPVSGEPVRCSACDGLGLAPCEGVGCEAGQRMRAMEPKVRERVYAGGRGARAARAYSMRADGDGPEERDVRRQRRGRLPPASSDFLGSPLDQ